MLLPCPHCGNREELEFTLGGPADIGRPPQPQALSDVEWAQYLFARVNPRGPHAERWCHTYGCGQWFNLLRDTLTHEVTTVAAMDDPQPPLGER